QGPQPHQMPQQMPPMPMPGASQPMRGVPMQGLQPQHMPQQGMPPYMMQSPPPPGMPPQGAAPLGLQQQPQWAPPPSSAQPSTYKQGRELLLRGRKFFEEGQTAQALNCFQEMSRLRSYDPHPNFWLGVVYEQMNCPQSAADSYSKCLRQALAQGMDSAQLRVNLGNVNEKLNHSTEAEFNYRRAIEIDEKNQAAHLNLGRLLLAKGEFAAAFQEFKRCSELGVSDVNLPLFYALALKGMGKEDDARAQLETFIARAENISGSAKTLAMAKRLLQDLSTNVSSSAPVTAP
ncbi:MAG TPA: tetratricopeptide repeat protein, partial [Candidatus Obscuribacterales bacterium]